MSKFIPNGKPGYVIPDFSPVWKPVITYLPNGWGVAIATITPNLAELFLACNREDNRPKRPHTLDAYESDMREGNWILTHQGIAFDVIGQMFDGQHRCESCVNSGKPFESLVYFGVGRNKEMAVTDTGTIRNAAQASRYILSEPAKQNVIATIRSFVLGFGSRIPFTNSRIFGFLETYRAILPFHQTCFSSSPPPAPVRGAICRAYYHADRDDLIRFSHLLAERIDPSEPRDRSVKIFRKFLASLRGTGGGSIQAELFRKAQRAIAAYLSGEVPAELSRVPPVGCSWRSRWCGP